MINYSTMEGFTRVSSQIMDVVYRGNQWCTARTFVTFTAHNSGAKLRKLVGAEADLIEVKTGAINIKL
jgi:hypothetical protein